MRRAALVLAAATALTALTALTACTSSGARPAGSTSASRPASRPASSSASAPSTPAPPSSSSVRPPSSSPPPSSPSGSAAQRALARMSEAERVGQLLMVDCPSTGGGAATETAIEQSHVGSVILDGTSYAGVQETRAVTGQLRSLAPGRVGLFVATDQEGGLVQRLQGPGFSRIPAATVQGNWSPAELRRQATMWGAQLRAAGVDLDLAPVLDTVPPDSTANPPIGDLNREYGRNPGAVTTHGLAVLRGLAAAGVGATVKHFPGLGRVTGNTDTTGGVTDTVTTADDAYLAPFRAAVQAKVPFVMMSTAIYSRLDPSTPAAFSRSIVTGLLRGRLGYRGVVISDDVGAAAQVAGYSVGQRAVRFVAAGGDVVLTVDANQAQAMTAALLKKAAASPAFRAQVDAAALRVLQAKQARGLLD